MIEDLEADKPSLGSRHWAWGAMRATSLMLAVTLAAGAPAPGRPKNKLEAVKWAGELVVVTRNSPTSYYVGPAGPTGIEYDMAKAFADSLGVKLHLVIADNVGDIVPMVARGDVDMAAAGLTVTPERQQQVRFGPPYQGVRQEVVYRQGGSAPRDVADLAGRPIEVLAGSSYVERLEALKQRYPDLTWTAVSDMDAEELLEMVWDGLVDVTIADSNVVSLSQQYYPQLHVAFDLGGTQDLAWAFPRSSDDSLYDAAADFIEHLRDSGELQHLLERYYGAAARSNYIDLTVYQLRIQNRLPRYRQMFEEAGRKYAIDWRLLAAIGYQESYWDPTAVSPTGVQGIMMLTNDTAGQMGIEDRLNAEQSIDGGTRYIRDMIDRMPPKIKGPDRIWMALAAYNLGLLHLQDARVITRETGGDPDKWNDVKERLPLLSRHAWYSKTKYGYARGLEAVRYVYRVRTYYDILVKLDQEEKSKTTTDAFKLQAPAI